MDFKDKARTAYERVAESRRSNRRQEAEELRHSNDEKYSEELKLLKQLLKKNLNISEDSFQFDTEGKSYLNFVPPKPIAIISDVVFFIQKDDDTDESILMLTFNNSDRYIYRSEIYSLADVGEALETYNETVDRP